MKVVIVDYKYDELTNDLIAHERLPSFMNNSISLSFDTKGIMNIKLELVDPRFLKIHIKPKKMFHVRLTAAYKAFVIALYGTSEVDAREQVVTKSKYSKLLKDIENTYAIEENDPDYGEWTLTLIMRSPKFYEEVKENGK